jgi:hypothetical protein
MRFFIKNNRRARIIGVLLLTAYSKLTYSVYDHKILGICTDIISGLAVIGIPILLFPLFNSKNNKILNLSYLASRLIEGLLMIIGGVFILIPSMEPLRQQIYSEIQIYFFISGALFLYVLLYRTQLVPKYISIWGIVATLALAIATFLRLFDMSHTILDMLIAPIVLNELFLALWFIIKGFDNTSYFAKSLKKIKRVNPSEIKN